MKKNKKYIKWCLSYVTVQKRRHYCYHFRDHKSDHTYSVVYLVHKKNKGGRAA